MRIFLQIRLGEILHKRARSKIFSFLTRDIFLVVNSSMNEKKIIENKKLFDGSKLS
jgi:hypothetical protein